MKSYFSTERKIVGGFAVALLVLCVVAGVAVWAMFALLGQLEAVSDFKKSDVLIGKLTTDMAQMVTAARGFMADRSEAAYSEWEIHAAEVKVDEARLKALFSDDWVQTEKLGRVTQELDRRMRETTPMADSDVLFGLWQAPTITQNRGLRDAFEVVREIDGRELGYLDERNRKAQSSAMAALLTIGLASVVALISVSGAVVVIMRDLRGRRKAAEDLELARQAAEAASVAKSSFLANMSHELRTPLTSIMGYADLLLDPSASAHRRQEFLQTMRRSSEHLLTLINDILDVSKIEAGRMSVEEVECRMLEVLADVDSLMRSRATEKGIAFSMEYQNAVPERVKTDPTRFRQILMNLVGNAVKFTDEGSVRMLVRYEEAREGGRVNGGLVLTGKDALPMIKVSVVDTGVGISPEQQGLLFQPFMQADISTTRRFGGTGLGLSISRRLAVMLGGDLTVTSELAKGSTFTLSLPMGQVEGTGMVQPGDVLKVLAGIGRTLETERRALGLRVLLAEDGPENREVIILHLRHAGCDVTAAEDGQQAYEMAMDAARGKGDEKAFDVVLMDMQMPVMDGYTATSKLRAAGYNGPIIALTAHAMKEDRERCLRVGCDEYAAKPVNMPGLLEMISRFSGKHIERADAGGWDGATTTAKLAAEPVLRGLTRKFCKGALDTVKAFRACASAEAWEELTAGAHKLAGAGGAYGFDAITREAKAVERLAHQHVLTAEMEEHLDQLEKACVEAGEKLEEAVR